MLAGVEGFNRPSSVQVVGQADVDGIDSAIGKECVVIRVGGGGV